MQTRLDFDVVPSRRLSLELELSGLAVLVDVVTGRVSDAWSYLVAAGADPYVPEGAPISFPVAQLPALANLPDRVQVVALGSLETLVRLATKPPLPAFPATVSRFGDTDDLEISWFDGDEDHTARLANRAIPAFLAIEVPYVADPDAWELLLSSSEAPPVVAHVRVNFEGFCEIDAVAPQMVESAPIPGLFRIDDSHFGFSPRFYHEVSGLRGFRFVGRPPRPLPRPRRLGDLPFPLRPHLRDAVPDVARHLDAYGGYVLAWGRGLGRRVCALAALEMLDAYPALIVCPPWQVWLWQRHLEGIGRTSALSHTRADTHITTYHDLALRHDTLSPVSIILDDPLAQEASTPAARAAVYRLLVAYPDAYRMVMSGRLPDDPAAQMAILDLARPGEFATNLPLPRRYPGDAMLSFVTHRDVYTSHGPNSDVEPWSSASSSVEVVSPSDELRAALAELRRNAAQDPSRRLAEALELVSVGTDRALGPKFPPALTRARADLVAGKKVAILCSHRQTISLLRSALAAAPVFVASGASADTSVSECLAQPGPGVLLVHTPSSSPSLAGFGSVIVFDYPWSLEVVEKMIGDAPGTSLLVLHAEDTPDDRLATFAALRREVSLTSARASDPPSAIEALYILVDRNPSGGRT